MKAMILDAAGRKLRQADMPIPECGPDGILLKVHACGVCRTDLHVVDGELRHSKLPLVPGHEIVGTVLEMGKNVEGFARGERVGVPWLGWTCGQCRYCRSGKENLCDEARFTGYTLDGGYAEYAVADHRYCFSLPERYGDVEAAPLLCAGLIGYRAFAATGDANNIGIYGFGAAAHIITQVAAWQGRKVFAFTKPGDEKAQRFALDMGAVWSGGSTDAPPEEMDACIVFAPVGALVPQALARTVKGGVVVCAGIHMSDIPSFPYSILWGERIVRSVANLTRRDGEEFMAIASNAPIRVETKPYPLESANMALDDLRSGRLEGAGLLITDQ